MTRTSRPRAGRPPRLQAAIVNVLRVHPELAGRPSKIAEVLAKAVPGFEDADGKKVSAAFSKLRRRFGNGFDPRQLHADGYHVSWVVVTAAGERVCEGCGASLGYVSAAGRAGTEGHNSFGNRLHRVFNQNPIPVPGRGRMISKAAVVAAEFGDGVEGRLARKALMGLEELCKSTLPGELPQEITTQLASFVESETSRRARFVREARIEEAKDIVTCALLKGVEKFPQCSPALHRLIFRAASYFPDLTAAANRPPAREPDPLEEEERAFRAGEAEGSRPADPVPEG